ncbi:hypothetical protein [Methylophaga sp.]|uniref:hypothetical protein n=1 Tax=Methylophaga sp. TaxID=2024840 RepID=UPI0014008AE3|nr:hypothetical protein [Methylophaga sp.]MTI64183.1 hypothetical protein [Methylophaga sp.]
MSELEKHRRRIYKGMPGLHRIDREQEADAALNSAYYWWFEYLKLSKNYWWVCRGNNFKYTKSRILARTAEDFGDVFSLSFRDWWMKTGCELFVEQLELPKVKQVGRDGTQPSIVQADKVTVEIPLNLTEQTIKKQVIEIVRQQSKRHISRTTSAKRKLAKLKRVRLGVLEKARDVWCLNQIGLLAADNVKGFEGVSPAALSLYEIGKRTRLVESCMPKPTDGLELSRKKRNGMKVAVKRMLNRADALIANVDQGVFPSFNMPELEYCWTDAQQKLINQAVVNGEWVPEHLFKLKQALSSSS